jgi:serine/threonine protein kinase
MMQITSAVKHLHNQKPPIQHRDLKIENVLQAGDGKWKLCDFGSCSTEEVPAKELSKKRLMDLEDEIEKTVTMLYRPPEMADLQLNVRKGYEINVQCDMWMIGCILFTVLFYRHPFQDSANAMAICNARYFIPYDNPASRNVKLVMLVHWLLCAHPQERPTSTKLFEVFETLPTCNLQDLEAELPTSVRDKIKREQKMYGARKSADLPDECMLPSERADRDKRNGGERSRAPVQAAAPAQAAPGGSDDAFDLNFALAPASASAASRSEAGTQRASRSDRAVAAPRNASPPAQDLLSFGEPAQSSARSPAAGFDDLLGFDAAPAAPNRGGPAVTSSPAVGDLLDLGFGDNTTPPRTGAVAASPALGSVAGFGADFAQFADFSCAPPMAAPQAAVAPFMQPAPMAGGGYVNSNAAPAQTDNLLDLQF